MLQVRSIHRLDQIEIALRLAAERHGGSILAVSRVSQDADAFTLCLSALYDPLLAADTRFAAFLPIRVAACAHGDASTLETISPREFCRILHRPELEPLAMRLEDTLRTIMEEAARSMAQSASALAERTVTEEQINMRGAIAQRIDCRGTKIEELGGVGVHDAQGG